MKKTKLLIILLILPLITSCWDERLLKDTRIVYLAGFDTAENNNYLTTTIIRDIIISESNRGHTSVSDELVMGKGSTMSETGLKINRSVTGDFDLAKARVIMFGKEVAERDIYRLLDGIYRNPRVNLHSKFALADNTANEIITHLANDEMQKGEFLYEMIASGEENTEIQEITLRSIRTYLFDDGKDFTVPVLSLDEEDSKVKVTGAALFHDRSFTGETLNPDEITMLLLLMGRRSEQAILTKKLDGEDNVQVSFNVRNVSKKKNLEIKEKIHVDIELELVVEVVDYPPDHLEKQEAIDHLNKQLSEILTERADALFKKLQTNQSDLLGLGRDLMAYHPDIWKEIKGENYYEEIVVNPKVKVKVGKINVVN